MAINVNQTYPAPTDPIGIPGAPPPPPPKGAPPPPRRRGNATRAEIINLAITNLRNALMARGTDPASALRFAQLILSRPGVTLLQNGAVRYHGQRYNAEDFAKTRLADFVTGEIAKRQNEAAIQSDPGYLAARAALGLDQANTNAMLQEEQQRAAIDWGDPAYAPDAQTGQAAAANPFSSSQLIAQAYAQNQRAAQQAANRAGTLFGGGAVSGQQQAARVQAGQLSEGTRSITDLLAQLARQRAAAQAGYSTGITSALAEAQQRLLQTGQIHAALPPDLLMRRFHVGPIRLSRQPTMLRSPRVPRTPKTPTTVYYQ